MRCHGICRTLLQSMIVVLLAAATAVVVVGRDERAQIIEHVTVFAEAGRFGGWPANHGVWSWGDEILVGFSSAHYLKRSPDRHQMDPEKPEEPRLARSLDGGRTWRIEAPKSLLPPEQEGREATELREPMNFTHPDFAMTVRFSFFKNSPSLFFFSTDRGHHWNGPFKLPLFGQKAIAARTDYIVNGARDAHVFLTAAKTNGREGRPLVIRTTDGGISWSLVALIGPEPEGFSIMPSSVRLSPTRLLTALRRKESDRDWIELYRSDDNGLSWSYLSRPAPFTGGRSGNPPSMIRLKDGRLCLTYGYRGMPYGIRARLSGDNGETWGDEIVLRDDGDAWDLGYTRTIQRRDGKIVTIYYFAGDKNKERTINATIWDPGKKRNVSRR